VGGGGRICPVCGERSKYFVSQKTVRPPREDAVCYYCGSTERTRLFYLFADTYNILNNNKKVLHFAPHKKIGAKLKKIFGKNYYTADKYSIDCMYRMDICDIKFDNEFFDLVIASFVLDQVKDDTKALQEIFRVLKNNGELVLIMPVTAGASMELQNETERIQLGGAKERQRLYNPDDFTLKLQKLGYSVQIITADSIASKKDIERMSLLEKDCIFTSCIFYCKKVKTI